ncbi:MAG: alkaline phosphatase family protein [Oceanospirillaceae bacterium]|nr:alkaline phosphatase family protein [Oceanospirillaceae bacterium]
MPKVVAGPLLRRLEANRLVFWLVGTAPLALRLDLFERHGGGCIGRLELKPGEALQRVRIGERAWIHLLDVQPPQPLPVDCELEYEFLVDGEPLSGLMPSLCYPGRSRPSVMVKSRIGQLLHGSCRKPHFPGDDALVRADGWLGRHLDDHAARPALLMLSGDQIYCDDVAGPMLQAVHQVVRLLGLFDERFSEAPVPDSKALYGHRDSLYGRARLLPKTCPQRGWRDRVLGGAVRPIFTGHAVGNHLIGLAEVLGQYLLLWAPQLWALIRLDASVVEGAQRALYERERKSLESFAAGLPAVQRLMAQVPVSMIFDDHDVTDDWNLTAGWEQAAYGHPFSRRIIGNAMLGYWLCQGWGNEPDGFDPELLALAGNWSRDPGGAQQDALIDRLLERESWSYALPTEPPLVVLDTRTQRWWSERSAGKPSGLMDWEALTELQQRLLGREAVVLVSAAPIFGVKLIESIQRVFTFFGQALAVDAENWMAHPGAAHVILNIFRHPKTPRHFVILSGDVHYSFVYDVLIRFRKNSPRIWQITCSGLKNEFPHRLLDLLDSLNRWLYAPRSPLNLFTRRRAMRVSPRRPTGQERWHRLVNRSGIGLVALDAEGVPVRICLLEAAGGVVEFESAAGEPHAG